MKKGADALKQADLVILAKYNQAGVVINTHLDILQFRGDTSPYLNNAPGAPNVNLLKMARQGLSGELTTAINKAKASGLSCKKEGLRIKQNGSFKSVFMEVIPLKASSADDRCFLVLFGKDGLDATKLESKNVGSTTEFAEEFASTKVYMQSIIDEREATNDELNSANEEMLSSNEELQSLNEELYSANEELQTAKEELQASNEEITTINDELLNQNHRLTQLSDDVENLLVSIHLPMVIVGGRFAGPALHAESRIPIQAHFYRYRTVDYGHQNEVKRSGS